MKNDTLLLLTVTMWQMDLLSCPTWLKLCILDGLLQDSLGAFSNYMHNPFPTLPEARTSTPCCPTSATSSENCSWNARGHASGCLQAHVHTREMPHSQRSLGLPLGTPTVNAQGLASKSLICQPSPQEEAVKGWREALGNGPTHARDFLVQ